MDYIFVISAIFLGLTVLATLAKFLDWFVHSDPKAMLRTMRWMLLFLLIVGVGILIYAIVDGQWALAMLDGAAVLIVPLFMRWRWMLGLFGPLRLAVGRFRRRPAPFDMEVRDFDPADPETVRRAAEILEAYVAKASLVALTDERRGEAMSTGEALQVLGLEPGADEATIRAARKRLLGLIHPDRGGSAWLAGKVQQASDTLLQATRDLEQAGGDRASDAPRRAGRPSR